MQHMSAETLPAERSPRFGVDRRSTDAMYHQALWGLRPAQAISIPGSVAPDAPAPLPAPRVA